MKFRSDQTGSRINTIAWNAMNAADKEKTIKAVCAGGLVWKNDKGLFKGWATSIENAMKGEVWKTDGVAVSTAQMPRCCSWALNAAKRC